MGTIQAVQGFVGEVAQTISAPIDALNLAVAKATLDLLQFLPKMPAARLYSDLVFQFGHSHPHPPTFGVPIPSVGPILASGCMKVLINGLPAARSGDMGLAVWCGGYFPIFEVMTGSSHVFIGGSRAARQIMDMTLHCLPDPFGGGKSTKAMQAIGKLEVAGSLLGVGMSALSLAASMEKSDEAEEKASDLQGTADAQSAAADAAADAVGVATDAAQLAADIAAAAMGLLMGKDPGVGFPFGMIIMGSPNVLIGGFPMPGWDTILKGLFKVLKPVIRKVQLKMKSGRTRNALCFFSGDPVEVTSGRFYTSQTDFEIDGRIPISFERLYDTSAIDYESSLGFGWTHPYDQHLWESNRYNCLVLRNEENRQVRFDKLAVGERYFQPLERVWLERTDENSYQLTDCKDGLIYRFGQVVNEEFKSEATALRLLEISDRNGNKINLKHEGSLLTEIENGSGGFVSLHYHDTAGKSRLTEIRQHLKNGQNINLMKFGYNGDAELIAATNRTYVPYTYNYENGLMTQHANRNGLSFYFEYEGEGTNARCVHTWGDGQIYERWISYLPEAKITKIKDGIGGETVYHYNDLELVTKIFNAEGGIFAFEYGERGEVVKEIDELGRTRSYSYDEQLNRTGVIKEDGTTQKVLFDEFCQPLTIYDETGNEWKREYDKRGNNIASITPLDARREYEYNRFGDIVKFRDALGNETNFEWSNAGQLSSVLYPLGSKIAYSYNGRNHLEEVINQFINFRVRYDYDDAGRIKRISEINSRNETVTVQKFEFDDQSNLTLHIDTLGNKTNYRYTGFDKIVETTDALGYKRHFKYDVEERVKELVNERGENHIFEYDLLDRIMSETGFDGAKTVYQYNPADEIIYQKDALGRETFFRRDNCGRIVNRLRSDTSAVQLSYDECGRITQARNEQSEVRISYDAAWRAVTETQNGQVINYDYDAENNRISRKLSGTENVSGVVEYNYDAERNLAGVKIGGQEINYRRDQSGRITDKFLPNGLQERFDYDINGRLNNQKVSVGGGREIVKRGYEWNALGNLVGISDSLRGSRRYQYDAIERLNRVERIISEQSVMMPEEKQGLPKKANGNLPAEKRLWQADDRTGLEFGQTREIEEFQYDGDGNLLERNSNVRGSRKFSYGRGDKLQEQEKIRYIYDAVGNLIEKRQASGESIRYQYDADNQLISISTETGGKIEFKYDAFGRRTAKITDQGTTGFLWEGDILLGEQKDSFCEYVHEGFIPLAKFQNFQVQTYHTDYLGTPKEVSAADGSLVWQGNYDEFGKVSEVKKQTEQNIRFQGQYEDAETGLYYNRFRYYDADSGRYINQDPIGLLGGTNFYAYGVNPVTNIDPLGLVKKDAAKDVPSKPGIYILTDPKTGDSYVGQGVDMQNRLSQSEHIKAQEMLDRKGVVVQYVEVDLGPDADKLTLREKKRILSRYEQQQFEIQENKGHTMLNSPKSPPESAKNKQRNQDLIDDKGASKKRKKTC